MSNIFNDNFLDSNECKVTIGPIITEIRDVSDTEMEHTDFDNIPLLPLRDMVLFPGVTSPISIGREASLALINQAYRNKQTICTVTQRVADIEKPYLSDMFSVGVTANIIKILELPDGTTSAILQVKELVHLDDIVATEPFLRAKVSKINEVVPVDSDKEMAAVIITMREVFARMLASFGEQETQEIKFAIKNIDNPLFLINFICVNSPLDTNIKQSMLEETNLKERALKLTHHLDTACQLMEIKANIQSRTREDITQQQREHFLHQQMRAIQDELGGSVEEQDVDELRNKAELKAWPKYAQEHFEKELRKLERFNTQSPEYSIQYTYLETLLNLPWDNMTKGKISLNKVERTLNRDHYGLENVKERIIEHMAVLQLRDDMKAPIICLYGPPGVGKTSLGRSIAEALKRKYVRMSLGGVHDEAEIRGHRKTYIGAMPGRIIKSLIKAEASNPVIILDEIDKLGSDHRGDPSSAMLEVLDPEQNHSFHDNYLDVDYDLSKVMFIATANNLSTIPPALLDRMELIEVSGYITEEKVEIAKRHLVPKELDNNGLKKENVKISKATLEYIVEKHTRESGVRELEKKINKVMRRIALEFAREGIETPHDIKPADVPSYLGAAEYSRDKYQGNEYAGVVTGLAWTAVGGEILFVETSLSKGKNGKLTLTGNLGDVMKESAMLALEYLKAHTCLLDISEEIFENWNIHIHVPEGAIPKDGPSAGITMVTSLASALTQRKVKQNLAMTGEITLRGKVLPVGGIKEKILAAKRAGIKDIILCEENRKNIEEIQPMYLKGLTFHYVNDVKEVLELALTNEKVNGAIDFCKEIKK